MSNRLATIGDNSQAFLPTDDPDVEAAPVPTDDLLKNVAALAKRQLEVEAEIADLTALLAQKNLDLKAIREGSLPLAMTEVGMTEFKLTGGYEVVVKDGVFGSITKENTEAAHKWLEDHGHGDLIKHTITITFGKGEEAWAAKFMRDMAQRKKPLCHELKRAVNHNTLGAFVREQARLAKEENLPIDAKLDRQLLSVFELRYAEVNPPKAPKVKP